MSGISPETIVRPYKDYGDKSQYLWKACGGVRLTDDLVDIDAPTFLRYQSRQGERALICGPNAIGVNHALECDGITRRLWVDVGSIVVSFESARFADMKASRTKVLGECPQMFALNCSRSSVAATLRAYRKRRDELAQEGGDA